MPESNTPMGECAFVDMGAKWRNEKDGILPAALRASAFF
jgi:hypothetical protein